MDELPKKEEYNSSEIMQVIGLEYINKRQKHPQKPVGAIPFNINKGSRPSDYISTDCYDLVIPYSGNLNIRIKDKGAWEKEISVSQGKTILLNFEENILSVKWEGSEATLQFDLVEAMENAVAEDKSLQKSLPSPILENNDMKAKILLDRVSGYKHDEKVTVNHLSFKVLIDKK